MVVALFNPSSSSSAFVCRSLDLRNPSSISYGSLFFIKLPPKPTIRHLHFLRCNAINNSDIQTEPEILLVPLLEQLGVDGRRTKTLLENYPSLRQIPFQSVRNRIQSLQSLGITGIMLSSLIVKRPFILMDPELDSLICFLLDDLEGLIKPLQIKRLLNVKQPLLLSDFQAKVNLFIRHGIPRDKLVYVLNRINPKAMCLKSHQEIEEMFAFLKRFGGVDLILRRPAVLDYSLESLIPRVEFTLELSGGDEEAATAMLRKIPIILAYKLKHLEDCVEFLKSYVGLSTEEVFNVIFVYSNLFSVSRKRKLEPRIGFLKNCGLTSSEIYKFLKQSPLYLSLSFKGNLAHKLVFLIKIGYQMNTKEFATAVGAVTRCSCKNMQEVISLYLNYGLTPDEICWMSRKQPQVLHYNSISLDEKMHYLVEEMGRDVRELLAFPAFLGYSFAGRIKHRYELVKKISGEGVSLSWLLCESTKTFTKKRISLVVNESSLQ